MKLSVADVTLGTMTVSDEIVSYIDTHSQELHITLDTIGATPEAQVLSRFLAEACVAPGNHIRCLEEDDCIRVKIDADSELGKFLASSG